MLYEISIRVMHGQADMERVSKLPVTNTSVTTHIAAVNGHTRISGLKVYAAVRQHCSTTHLPLRIAAAPMK